MFPYCSNVRFLAPWCVYVRGFMSISSILEKLQTWGHRRGNVAPSPVDALDFYRVLGSALPSLVYSHRI